jgi:anti-sigma factor RsiW
MDCKGFRETLDLYLDGELAPEATSAAQLHEQECDSCHRAAASLLHLRRQMKSAVAQHQPPPELVNAVQRISQPAWKRWFGMSDLSGFPGSASRKSFPVWRKNITVPLPVFALLLIAVAFGAWLVSRRPGKVPSSIPKAQSEPAIQAAGGPAGGEVMAFSRFDRGQRASIYKMPRQQR